ncbi:MAG: hypothetical protein ACOYYS_00475 [Chloroflexota bacterium]
MNGMFLDPQKPLSTCSSADCEGCPVQNHLHCHFHGSDLARFLAIAFPPFIVGGVGIARTNAWLLIPWIVLCIGYFGFIEIRVMCSHCPHYAEPGITSLKCWANYGSPKLWKYRPGPMTHGENITFFAGGILIAAYPLAFILAGMQWLLLALFVGSIVGFGSLLYTRLCNHCMNFACPLNHVEPGVRALFFARNPVVARAWEKPKE